MMSPVLVNLHLTTRGNIIVPCPEKHVQQINKYDMEPPFRFRHFMSLFILPFFFCKLASHHLAECVLVAETIMICIVIRCICKCMKHTMEENYCFFL